MIPGSGLRCHSCAGCSKCNDLDPIPGNGSVCLGSIGQGKNVCCKIGRHRDILRYIGLGPRWGEPPVTPPGKLVTEIGNRTNQ